MNAKAGHKFWGRRFLRGDEGSITVEFVVTFPLLLAALAFAFEFGRLFVAHHTLVNNVRSAERFLSRSDLSNDRISQAEEIVRTGSISGGTAPAWVESATVTITPAQTTFADTNFRLAGQVIRIEATVNFQFLIATFIGDERATVPITIVEDIRHVGD